MNASKIGLFCLRTYALCVPSPSLCLSSVMPMFASSAAACSKVVPSLINTFAIGLGWLLFFTFAVLAFIGVPDTTCCGGESGGRLSFNERVTLSRCDALPNASVTEPLSVHYRSISLVPEIHCKDTSNILVFPNFFDRIFMFYAVCYIYVAKQASPTTIPSPIH